MMNSNQRTDQPKRFIQSALVGLFLFNLMLVACVFQSTPPGSSVIAGGISNADETLNYSLHYWDEGLRLLIWDDLAGGSDFSSGSGSTGDPVFRLEGISESSEGLRYEFQLETSDGMTADFILDGRSFDLANGAVFFVTPAAGGFDIRQYDIDLSQIPLTHDGVVEFSRNQPELVDLFANLDPG